MKFMILLRGEDKFLALSPSEQQSVVEAYRNWSRKLAAEGRLVEADALSNTGVILSSVNGVITEGPFIESKDMAGGYFVIEADSLEHATVIAKESPSFSYGGTIELRQTGHGG